MIITFDDPLDLDRTCLLFLARENRGAGLMRALEAIGHLVHPCHETEEAISVALSGTVGAALVLSEHDPTMAYDFCRKARSNDLSISIIALLPPSLAARIGLRVELLEAGADLCLASTTSSRELSARLCSQMRLNRRVGLGRLAPRIDDR